MVFDLRGESTMSPIVGMLYAAVQENNVRLKSITEGMSQEELDYRGLNDEFNSTAQLIKHLLFVDLNWVYRIKNQVLPDALQIKHGPMLDEQHRLPRVEGISLSTLMCDYEEVMQMLRSVCTQLEDIDLDRVVLFGHHNEKQASIRWGLWHIADHSRYHQAHINLLRKWYARSLN